MLQVEYRPEKVFKSFTFPYLLLRREYRVEGHSVHVCVYIHEVLQGE